MTKIADFILRMFETHFGELLLLVMFAALVWIGAMSQLEATKTWALGQGNTVIGAILAIIMKKAGDTAKEK